MHRHLSVCAVVLLAVLALAQQKSASSAKPAAAPNLPSEEVVNAFMQQTLGYDPAISWKIGSIKPAPAEGLAEVNVTVSSPQGSQAQKFYVTPDSTHVIIGEILPFGPHPFDAVRDQLQKGINGPSHGAATAPVMVVEFSDLQCPIARTLSPRLIAWPPKTRMLAWSSRIILWPCMTGHLKQLAMLTAWDGPPRKAFGNLFRVFTARSQTSPPPTSTKSSQPLPMPPE